MQKMDHARFIEEDLEFDWLIFKCIYFYSTEKNEDRSFCILMIDLKNPCL